MTHVDMSPGRLTSVTIRSTTRANLKAGLKLFRERGLDFSEQRLMRECLRFALQFWRGRKGIAARSKKYNKRSGPYQIVPFYTTEALRSVAWARCHHAGMSLSRLMDFALTQYLPRVIEYWLRFAYHWRDKVDAAAWQAKYARRQHRSAFIISYQARTEKNDGSILSYIEKSEILPWPPPQTVAA